jgi:transcriptional regulator with XRE-family HTH domain
MSWERGTFSVWICAEIVKRGWKASDLARAANVSKGTISDILNERRRPGLDVCVAIARALKYPPEDVLRIAGLLPPDKGLGDLSIRQLLQGTHPGGARRAFGDRLVKTPSTSETRRIASTQRRKSLDSSMTGPGFIGTSRAGAGTVWVRGRCKTASVSLRFRRIQFVSQKSL